MISTFAFFCPCTLVPLRTLVLVLGVALAAGCTVAKKSSDSPASDVAAVVALVDKANQALDRGEYDLAAQTLERALRLEPGNARLWSGLAQVSLAQGRSREAVQFATKAITLSADPDERTDNWSVIAKAYTMQGDLDRAREARQKAAAQ